MTPVHAARVPHLECPFVQRQRLVALPSLVVQDGEVGAALGHVGVAGPVRALAGAQLGLKSGGVVCVGVVFACGRARWGWVGACMAEASGASMHGGQL